MGLEVCRIVSEALLRVLLGAHTIDPSRGSEPGIGWGWAESLARHPRVDRVDVLAHPIASRSIHERLRRDPALSRKLRFHWVLPSPTLDPWKRNDPGSFQKHRVQIHYQLWQRKAIELARDLAGETDVAHHVTLGNIFLPTFVSKLGCPYLLGPVAGGQAVHVANALRLLARNRDASSALELARSMIVGIASRRPANRGALAGASAILCTNPQTLRFAARYQAHCELMIDGGIDELPAERAQVDRQRPRVLWVGRLEARKDPLVVLDIAEHLRRILPDAYVVTIGDGPLRGRVKHEVSARNLGSKVFLKGLVPYHLDDLRVCGVVRVSLHESARLIRRPKS